MHPSRFTVPLLIVCVASLWGSASPALGQSSYADPYRFWKWPVQDGIALVDGLASRQTLYAVGAGALLYAVARHDGGLTEEVRAWRPPGTDLPIRVVEEIGNARAVRPVAALILVGTLMTDDRRVQDAAFTSLEAVMAANLITNSLKLIVGRARPWQEEGAMTFEPFSGNTSFPSGHATTAFALVTPWLMYYPNLLTPGLLVLSTGTAFSRMVTNNHWFTDVVAGSAIGFVTGYWLSRRHQRMSERVLVAPVLRSDQVGVYVTLKLDA